MEIKVNDYVRTKDGIIDKVIIEYNGHCASPNCNCKHVSCERNYYDEDKIIKTSSQIIDLIEVGDYVNGRKVSKINLDRTLNKEKCILCAETNYDCLDIVYKNEDIKSIATKEQFENISYKVGE